MRSGPVGLLLATALTAPGLLLATALTAPGLLQATAPVAPGPLQAAGPVAPGVAAPHLQMHPQAPSTGEVRRAWMIMGTFLEVVVFRPDAGEEVAVADARAAYDAIAAVDRRMSLYREESELVRLNARAGTGPVPVSRELFEVLEAALHYGRLSGGAFDVTVTPLVELWGFYRQEDQEVPPPEAIRETLERVGPGRLRLDSRRRTVALAEGSRVDLGAIAKGWAVDRALDTLADRGVEAALVDLGGNVGLLGTPPGQETWTVGIRHPRASEMLLGELHLSGRTTVATSGDYERFFEAGGRRYSHLLDPRTGRPIQEVVAVTVVAPDATAADALSTAAIVLGSEPGLRLLEGCRAIEGLVATLPAGPDPAVAGAKGNAVEGDEDPAAEAREVRTRWTSGLQHVEEAGRRRMTLLHGSGGVFSPEDVPVPRECLHSVPRRQEGDVDTGRVSTFPEGTG